MIQYTCPCCGYKTIVDEHLYDICPICFWEDDLVQCEDPYFAGGANENCLIEAQINFLKFGVFDYKFKHHVREANNHDRIDPQWKPYLQLNEEIWMYLNKDMEKSFTDELKKEISSKHILYGMDVEAVAKREDSDDVLFLIKQRPVYFAVVHLSFSRHVEKNPIFPKTRIYTNINELNEKENII